MGQFTAQDQVRVLKDSSGTLMSSYALTSGSAVRSEIINLTDCLGYAGLEVTVDASGVVDIFAEYSIDGSTFSQIYTTNMSGTTTQEGDIKTALANDTELIQFTPRPFPYMQLVFDPDANSTVTVYFSYTRDR